MKRSLKKVGLFSLLALFALVFFSVMFAAVIKKTVMALIAIGLLIVIAHYLVKLAKNLDERKVS
ncbi:hypothetical protein [Vreelandella sulfidaeris]